MRTRPLLLGHRGARAVAAIPENTYTSFDRALADGCDGFEFDVRMTKDGCSVICHDPEYRGQAIEHGSREQVSELLLLEDVLSRYSANAFLDIELKVPGLEESTASALQSYCAGPGCVVSSFLPQVLRTLRQHDQNVALGYICDRADLLDQWRELDVEYVIPNRKLASLELLNNVHDEGKKLLVWTVNRRADMLRLFDWGVDGVISDRTALLAQTLGNRRD